MPSATSIDRKGRRAIINRDRYRVSDGSPMRRWESVVL